MTVNTLSHRPAWIEPFETDPLITDVCVGVSNGIYVDRGRGMEIWKPGAPISVCDEDLRNWILAELSRVGKTWDAKFPFIDATLQAGYRLHAAFPPVAKDGILLSLRRLPRPPHDVSATERAQIVREKWAHSPAYERLAVAAKAGETILIAGATGSGKTTLINDLLGEIHTNERIVSLEDTSELAPAHPHFVGLISRPANADGFGEVTLRMLLKQTLRMRPDRIVLGECRGAEVLELLQALNTGHRGGMGTVHANSARDALRRLELLCLLHGEGRLPIPAIRELLACGITWIAHVKREGTRRSISELMKVEGREGDTILLRAMLNPENLGSRHSKETRLDLD